MGSGLVATDTGRMPVGTAALPPVIHPGSPHAGGSGLGDLPLAPTLATVLSSGVHACVRARRATRVPPRPPPRALHSIVVMTCRQLDTAARVTATPPPGLPCAEWPEATENAAKTPA